LGRDGLQLGCHHFLELHVTTLSSASFEFRFCLQ
jgi:hypothetical protein